MVISENELSENLYYDNGQRFFKNIIGNNKILEQQIFLTKKQ